MKEAVKGPQLQFLNLDFFSIIASLTEQYLRAYQMDKPMMPFMCNDFMCKSYQRTW